MIAGKLKGALPLKATTHVKTGGSGHKDGQALITIIEGKQTLTLRAEAGTYAGKGIEPWREAIMSEWRPLRRPTQNSWSCGPAASRRVASTRSSSASTHS